MEAAAAAGVEAEEERQTQEAIRKVNEENRLKAPESTAKEKDMTYPYDPAEWVEFIEDGQVYGHHGGQKGRDEADTNPRGTPGTQQKLDDDAMSARTAQLKNELKEARKELRYSEKIRKE